MAKITVASGVSVADNDFWVNSGAISTEERFAGQTSQTGSLVLGIGEVATTYSEYVFEQGDFTFHYVGEWELNVSGSALTSTTSAQGTYQKIVIEKNGEPYATLTLDEALAVDFGSQGGIDLLGLGLGDLTAPLLSLVLGNAGEGALANLHLLATPSLPDLAADADLVIGGGAEDDTIQGTSSSDTIDAAAGNDVVHAGGGDDTVYGRRGNDTLHGDDGDDVLQGGAGSDSLYGGTGSDTASYATATASVKASLTNPSGNTGDARGDLYSSIENLIGTSFSDSLTGDGLANRLDGRAGDDRISGVGGNDILLGGIGNDSLSGGTGTDRMFGNEGSDVLSGGDGNDYLSGSAGNDRLYGQNGNDVILGGDGNDHVSGSAGTDTLTGGAGNDTLFGGAGADTLTGGLGADTFLFSSRQHSTISSSNRDSIADFSRTEGDVVHLATIDANNRIAGSQSFDFIGSDSFHREAGELRYEIQGGETFIYGDVNGDAVADFSITLDRALAMQASDFLL